MHEIITLLQNPTSNLTLILIVAIFVIVPNFPKIAKYIPFLNTLQKVNKISDVQDEKYPKLEQGVQIMEKLDKIANNHLHELPEMRSDISGLKTDMVDVKVNLAKINTSLEFILKK